MSMSKRSRTRMTAYKTCEASGDVDYMEAFEKPAIIQPVVKAPVTTSQPEGCPLTQPEDDGSDSSESESTAPVTTSQPEGCPLTQPEDDGSDSSESESTSPLPTLYVLPDTTVIVSPHDAVAVFKPFNPNEDMTQDVCDVILEEVIGRKVMFECQNSRLSLETATRNVCQDVATLIISADWQKEVRRQLQSHLK